MPKASYSLPPELPILPLRDTVLFPGAVIPLTVGRDSSLALLDTLQGEEKILGVVAQLDPRIEDPVGTDLHAVGTVGKVHKMVRTPNGNVVVFLEGLRRMRVVEVIGLKPFLRASVEDLPDTENETGPELTALYRNTQELFREVVSRSPQLSDDLQGAANNMESPSQLADFVAGTLPSLNTLLRQELLETPSVRKRLEILIRELTKEKEVLELRAKIHEQVQ
ncbi:MAG: LON peptidase substrate-binding domain-containing protein, partial [Candidatus Acidiferrales bacterium]